MSLQSPTDLAAFAALLRVEQGSKVDLHAVDPGGTPGCEGDRDAADVELKALRDELTDFQERLWAEKGQSLLIVLQAMDGGGKDGTIRKVFTAFNPQGTRVTGFGVPNEEELAHDFLWRIHHNAPGTGRIGIFNRSHYEDVLVVRVNGWRPKSVWSGRYELINAFEQTLVAAGTTILKFMLHISRDEQRDRLESGWRIRPNAGSSAWPTWRLERSGATTWGAYADALSRCSTPEAPWFVIPADRKWYRDLAVARVVADAARRMNPQFPEPKEDLSGVTVRD